MRPGALTSGHGLDRFFRAAMARLPLTLILAVSRDARPRAPAIFLAFDSKA